MLSYSNNEISLWDLRNIKKVNSYKSSIGEIKSSEFDYSGGFITVSGTNGISILNTKSGKDHIINSNNSYVRYQMNSRNEGYAITNDGEIYQISF